ncbi:MAG: alkaline phosphatase family protein [Terriglobales bacterium]
MSRRLVCLSEAAFVCLLLIFAMACGSGLSRDTGGNPKPVSISISPTSATVTAGNTQQFTAVVSGATDTSVQWMVNNIPSGNADVGTISSSGLYTAPQTDASKSVTVTAVALADTTKTASATVVVNPVSTNGVSVTISPTTATVTVGSSQEFQAQVTGTTNTAVTWSVDGVNGGNSTIGTISNTGNYTAPATAGTHTVTATSVADSTKSASASVTVQPASTGISVTISPTTATLAVGTNQQFKAQVTGTTNTAVTWSVDGVNGGDSSVGTITDNGSYTAPLTAGSHTVTATSVADPQQSASASVSVIRMTVSPDNATVAPSGTQQFTATVDGTSNTAVTWSVDGVGGGNSTVGTIDSTGLYTAPATEGTHTVTATTVVVPTYSVNTSVTVSAGNTGDLRSIKHIIFISQENRSFDTYFGKLNEYRAKNALPTDVDGLPDNCSSSNSDWTVPCGAMNKAPDANGYLTTPIYAFHLKTKCIENTSADWIVSHWAFNAENPSSDTPLMDGFVVGAASAALANGFKDVQGIRAMGFYTGDDLEHPYWLASQFGTSDRWFAPAPTKTEPNRYFMVGATTGGHAYPAKTTIPEKTIFDLLQAAGVSWKIYAENGYTSASVFSGFMSRYADHIVPLEQFITDAQSGNLPSVAYVEKPDADQHPGSNVNIEYGVAEVRDLVNAVMYDSNGGPGPSWKDSVVIVTFDEGGGLYDHVAPPTNVPNPDGIKPIDICTSSDDPRCSVASLTHLAPPYDPDGDFTRYGFRVPLMVVSPFSIPHYVSHNATDFTAWMKLVEIRFGLPSLNARDAAAIDMTEFFDFKNVPWATPPANPPVVNYGQCYDSLP